MLQPLSNSNPGVTSNQSSRNTGVSGVFSCPKAGFSLIFSLIGSTGENCTDKTLHAVGTFTLHLVSHMAIHVQRKGRCGVTQITLHRLDIVASADRGDCVGVTQVVETGIGTTDGRDDTLVLAVDCWLCQVCTKLVGKDQTLRILPVTANRSFCCICHRRCCCNRARTVCAAAMVRLRPFFGETSS